MHPTEHTHTHTRTFHYSCTNTSFLSTTPPTPVALTHNTVFSLPPNIWQSSPRRSSLKPSDLLINYTTKLRVVNGEGDGDG